MLFCRVASNLKRNKINNDYHLHYAYEWYKFKYNCLYKRLDLPQQEALYDA